MMSIFLVAKLDAIKRSAKRFPLNADNYTDFAARNSFIKLVSNDSHSSENYASNLHRDIANILKLQIMATQLAK